MEHLRGWGAIWVGGGGAALFFWGVINSIRSGTPNGASARMGTHLGRGGVLIFFGGGY